MDATGTSTHATTQYIEHDFVKPQTVERRTYQEVIAAQASEKNSICVLPTGLGKTPIAALTAAERLKQQPNGQILVLAPTRPLAEQHHQTFQELLTVPEDQHTLLTGKTAPKQRQAIWQSQRIICATPQVVQNDIIAGTVPLHNIALLVCDECHRAVKDYPYVYIAEQYAQQHTEPRIMGLTASPGGEVDKIEEVGQNLYADRFEIRTEQDPDVKPYIQQAQMHWIPITLPKHFAKLQSYLQDVYKERLHHLKQLGLIKSVNIGKKELLRIRGWLGSQLGDNTEQRYLLGMSILAGALKAHHALELLETQGIHPLHTYIQKLKKDSSKAAQTLLNHETFSHAVAVCEWMYNNNMEHPKLERLRTIVEEKGADTTMMIFTQYRSTVDVICHELSQLDGIEPVAFKGQKEGFTQKKQESILEDFRHNTYNVLVSTSVGEEGLDIPAVDTVIFYEPIPSEIRSIQRRGRTARQAKGEILVLMAENTRDQYYYWSAYHKEKRMKRTLQSLQHKDAAMSEKKQESTSEGQQNLVTFAQEDAVQIYIDDREQEVAKTVSETVKVHVTRLEVADFLVSEAVAVERKTAGDFVSSIIDNRLFEQLNELKRNFERPVLIIEGTDFFQRHIHPNALYGALSAIALDYQIPVLWAQNQQETAQLLCALAKREQEEKERSLSLRGEKMPHNTQELQKYMVAGIPFVDNTLSERLLEQMGSVKDVFGADETALQRVKGIGEKKAREIYKILNEPYDSTTKRGE